MPEQKCELHLHIVAGPLTLNTMYCNMGVAFKYNQKILLQHGSQDSWLFINKTPDKGKHTGS